MKHRLPMSRRRFSWGRIPSEGACTWRLFRKGVDGRVYMSMLTFRSTESRASIAESLRRARKALLDKADECDFIALGLAA